MIKRIITFIIVILLVLFCIGCNRKPINANDFSLSVSCDKQNVVIGDTVIINVSFKNLLSKDIDIEIANASSLEETITIDVCSSDLCDFNYSKDTGKKHVVLKKNQEINISKSILIEKEENIDIKARIIFNVNKNYSTIIQIETDILTINVSHYHSRCLVCNKCTLENCPEFLNNICTGHKELLNSLELEISDDGEYYIIKKYYDKEIKNLKIPSVYKDIPIKVIDSNAFENCSKLENIVLPDCIEIIRNSAFYNCKSLKKINIPNNIKIIGNKVFENCENLEYTIENGNGYLGNEQNKFVVLAYVKKDIKKFVYNKETKIVLNDVFKLSTELSDVIYPGTLEDYCNLIFSNEYSNPMCHAINFYRLYSSDEDIELITHININIKIPSINNYLFYGFDCLKEVIIGNSVNEIGVDAFSNCSSLERLFIGKNVNCVKENKITNGVIYFENSKKPDKCLINEDAEIVYGTTYHTTNLKMKLSDDKLYYIVNEYIHDSDNDTIIIPEMYNGLPVKCIGENVFSDYFDYKKIYIPKSIIEIGKFAFGDSQSKKEVYYCGTMFDWLNINFENINSDPIRYNTDFYLLDDQNEFYKLGKEITIPDGVNMIKSCLFYYYPYETIVIPNSVKLISMHGFESKNTLENVYFKGSIEDWCDITFIDEYSNPMYYANNFYNLNENNEFELLNHLIIPNHIREIKDYTFYGFENVTSLTVPKNISTIGFAAFEKCSNINNVYFDGIIEFLCDIDYASIGSLFFTDATENLYMLDKKGNYNPVTEIKIDNTSKINDYSFKNLKSIKKVTISRPIEVIGKGAFENCTNLEEIVLPSTIKKIDSSSFYYCNNIKNIYYNGTIEDWMRIYFQSSTSNPMQYCDNFYVMNNDGVYESIDKITIPKDIINIDYQIGGKFIKELIIHNSLVSFKYLMPMENLQSVYYQGHLDEWLKLKIYYKYNPVKYANNFYLLNENNEYYQPSTAVIEDGTTTLSSDLPLFGFESIVIPKSIDRFSGGLCMESAKYIYYKGTMEDWFNIKCFYRDYNPMYYAEHFFMLNDKNEWYEVTEIIIPSSVSTIDTLMCGFDYVTKIFIPASVKRIMYKAFMGCERATIYCEVSSIPNDSIGRNAWDEEWNPLNRPVVWNYSLDVN